MLFLEKVGGKKSGYSLKSLYNLKVLYAMTTLKCVLNAEVY